MARRASEQPRSSASVSARLSTFFQAVLVALTRPGEGTLSRLSTLILNLTGTGLYSARLLPAQSAGDAR
jgi:hypothetical protein